MVYRMRRNITLISDRYSTIYTTPASKYSP